jgi:hypothetical protein
MQIAEFFGVMQIFSSHNTFCEISLGLIEIGVGFTYSMTYLVTMFELLWGDSKVLHVC